MRGNDFFGNKKGFCFTWCKKTEHFVLEFESELRKLGIPIIKWNSQFLAVVFINIHHQYTGGGRRQRWKAIMPLLRFVLMHHEETY